MGNGGRGKRHISAVRHETRPSPLARPKLPSPVAEQPQSLYTSWWPHPPSAPRPSHPAISRRSHRAIWGFVALKNSSFEAVATGSGVQTQPQLLSGAQVDYKVALSVQSRPLPNGPNRNEGRSWGDRAAHCAPACALFRLIGVSNPNQLRYIRPRVR